MMIRILVVVCMMAAAVSAVSMTLLNRIEHKYEVVRVDTADLYFKHPVKAGTVLFSENVLHAHGVKAAHPTTATFRFKAYGKSFEVKLEKNVELFSPRFIEMGLRYSKTGEYEGREVVRENGMPEEDNCWYQSWTSNDENEPMGVMDTCGGGFRGMVYGHGEGLGIEPAGNHLSSSDQKAHAARLFGVGTDPATVDMHIVYKLSDSKLQVPFSCSVGAESAVHTHTHAHDESDPHAQEKASYNKTVADLYSAAAAPSRRKLLQDNKPIKYIELMLVNDFARMQLSRTTPAWDVSIDSYNIANYVATVYARAPSAGSFKYGVANSQVDVIYRPILVGMTSFLNNDPYTIATNGAGETPVTSLLPAFNSWRSNPSNLIVSPATPGCPNHDNGHLLSGFKFDGSTLGYAGVSTMCSFSTSGGIDQCLSASSSPTDAAGAHNNPQLHGAIVSHEMGHNFGMQHDSTNGNTCESTGYIMNAAANTNTPPTQFSSCSVTYLNTFIASLVANNQPTTCLDNIPSIQFNSSGVCGDGFVNAGEQCDCGTTNCWTDPASTDKCCTGAGENAARKCQFRNDISPAAVCRATVDNLCCTKATDTPACQARPASANITCRAASASGCDIAEMCDGTGQCPIDLYKGAGAPCTSTVDGAGACYKAQCVTANQVCRLQGASVAGNPWEAASSDLNCDSNPCGDLYCSSVSNTNYQGCYSFSTNSGVKVQVPDGVPCGENAQCKSRECVPSAELNNEFYYAPTAWESCSECNTIQSRSAVCTSYGTNQRSTSIEPCSTPSGLPALTQLCRNDTLGCVYAADVGDDNVSLFGETVAKNTLMFAVLGLSALILVVLACCYQAVTYGHEKEEASPENSQVDGDPEFVDDK